MAETDHTNSLLGNRIARFADLQIIDTQAGHSLPQDVADLIWSRKLLPVITRADSSGGPFGTKAPITGAGDLALTYAVCPAGTGPTLHAHRKTYETFTVMRGRFEFSAGPGGDEKIELGPLDVISVPPGIHRAFRNVSNEEGVLQVLITGGDHDQKDIFFPAHTARQITNKGAGYLDYFKKAGLLFEHDPE